MNAAGTAPTKAMIEAGRVAWYRGTQQGITADDLMAIYLAMKASDAPEWTPEPLRYILCEAALRECEAYLEQRADAEIDHTGTTGNEEMRLLVEIRQALGQSA